MKRFLKQAKNIKEFCAAHAIDEDSYPFFKGYKKEDGADIVICGLNKGQCSPFNWDI